MSKCVLTRFAIKGHFSGKRGGEDTAFPGLFILAARVGGGRGREGRRESRQGKRKPQENGQ